MYKVVGNHIWTLKEYDKKVKSTKQSSFVKSDIFHISRNVPPTKKGGLPKQQLLSFQLLAYLSGHRDSKTPKSSIGLMFKWVNAPEMLSCNGQIKVSVDFYVLNKDNDQELKMTFVGTRDFTYTKSAWGYYDAFSKDKIEAGKETLLANGDLRIGCKFKVSCEYPQEVLSFSKNKLDTMTNAIRNYLGCSFKNLMDNDEFCDVTLCCQGTKFRCHKIVLVARSEVFKAMFMHDSMKEGQTGIIDIKDAEPEPVQQMINFLYLDACDNIGKHVFGLLPLAEKYDLPGLKASCEQWMADNFCTSNAVEILLVADMYNCTELANLAINFIALNYSCFTITDWGDIKDRGGPTIIAKLQNTYMYLQQNAVISEQT